MTDLVVDKHILEDAIWSASQLKPEILLIVSGFVILGIGAFSKKERPMVLVGFSLLSILSTIFLSANQLSLDASLTLFSGGLIIDSFGAWGKILIGMSGLAIVALYTSHQMRHQKPVSAEFFFLLINVIAGGFLLVNTHHLLTIFLSLEILSLASYALVAYKKDDFAIEAALKYFLFGATTTAIMLFGMSLLYGFTGSLDLIGFDFAKGLLMANDSSLLFIACFMVFGAILFKVSIFPFHIWTPDVYQGASYPVVTLLTTVPKIAGIIALSRLFFAFQKVSLAFEGVTMNFHVLMGVLALASMLIGTFTALRQRDLKRLLAYSSIAFAGFLLAAVLQIPKGGVDIFLLFLTSYTLMSLGVFSLGQYFSDRFHAYDQVDFNGLFKINPWAGGAFLIMMISLTGLPPTLGFSAKLFLFTGLFQSFQMNGSTIFAVLGMVGILLTIISLYFYLRFPYAMIFKKYALPKKKIPEGLPTPLIIGLVCSGLILLFFFKLNWLLEALNSVTFAF